MFLSKLFNRATKNNDEINVEVFGATDIGRRRVMNEDTFLFTNLDEDKNGNSENNLTVEERGVLMLVADGMGGAAAGAEASEMAAETIRTVLKEIPQEMSTAQQLETSVRLANQRIFEHAQAHRDMRGMGTTVTAAHIQSSIACIAQVGDSRAYLLRGDEIRQLTKDQSLAQYLVDIGQITRERMRVVPQNVILQAVGTEKNIDIVVSSIQLCKDDILLLCSDGLSNKVSNDEIHEIVSTSFNLNNAVYQLIDLANERGGEDNITVVLARFNGDALVQSNAHATMGLEMNYQAA